MILVMWIIFCFVRPLARLPCHSQDLFFPPFSPTSVEVFNQVSPVTSRFSPFPDPVGNSRLCPKQFIPPLRFWSQATFRSREMNSKPSATRISAPPPSPRSFSLDFPLLSFLRPVFGLLFRHTFPARRTLSFAEHEIGP